jgi:sulfur relay (sulfurtransferase) complex TusBCD TusD component (DsrE family)
MASLLLCLFTGPRSEGAYTVRQLARAALDANHRVQIFLGGDGTFHFESLQPLRDSGARVMMCSADAAVRGWDRPGAPGRGSFVDLGGMAAEADAMAGFGCVASLDGRVVVRDGPSTEAGWLALRVATALTFSGRPVRAVLEGNGAGWAASALEARDWLGGDVPADLDGLVDDAGGTVLVGASTLEAHGLDSAAVRASVRVVDDAWQAAAPVPPPPSVLHALTQAVTDPLAVRAVAADAGGSTAVRTLGLHDGVYEAGALARALGEAGIPDLRLCADDCRRRGVEAPPARTDEYPAIVDAILGASATFVW